MLSSSMVDTHGMENIIWLELLNFLVNFVNSPRYDHKTIPTARWGLGV